MDVRVLVERSAPTPSPHPPFLSHPLPQRHNVTFQLNTFPMNAWRLFFFLPSVLGVPSISILSPGPSDTIISSVHVAVHITEVQPGMHAQFYLDDVLFATATLSPDERGFSEASLAIPDLPVGNHYVEIALLTPTLAEVLATAFTSFNATNFPPRMTPPPLTALLTFKAHVDILSADLFAHCARRPGHDCVSRADCGGRGGCIFGHCVCERDFVGARCEHDLFETQEYTPPSPWRNCPAIAFYSRGVEAALSNLTALFGACASTDPPPHVIHTRIHGFAAQMHFLSEAITHAVATRRRVEFVGGFTYAAHCHPPDPRCHFRPFGACAATWASKADVGLARDPPPYSDFVPEEARPRGVLWWRSVVMGALLAPNERLEAVVRHVKTVLRWPPAGGVVGVHVRHGDSCAHAEISDFKPQCAPLERHWALVQKMRATYGFATVFLATDDARVVEEAEALGDAEGVRVMALAFDRGMFSSDWFLEFRMKYGYIDPAVVAETAVVDLLLLAHADALVGTFASQYSRLGVPPPYCFHFMERRRVGGFGIRNC
jgi:hypothetical protein